MRKIAAVTGSRAEYWLLRPLLVQLKQAGYLKLLVTGEHLIGPGLNKIREDGFDVYQEIECLSQDTYLSLVQAIATGQNNFAEAFSTLQPDIIILLGDRYEIFAAAVAAYSLKIPIAHIHGGEITHGALDDGYRHAISKLSHIHFVSHEEYKNRLLRMGEMPEKIYTVGAIGLDHLNNITISTPDSPSNYFLMTLHSSTLGIESPEQQADIVIKALEDFPKYHIIVTQSNSDPGGKILNQKWLNWQRNNLNVTFVDTFGDAYLKIAALSQMVIGNSSSGILEIPYLNRPVLNLGIRQEGRIMPRGVYHAPFEVDTIKQSVQYILENYQGSSKIYGEPGTISDKIFKIITKISLDSLIHKRFFDANE